MGDPQHTVEVVSFDMESIVEEILRSYAEAHSTRGPEFTLRYEPSAPRHAVSDPVQLRQSICLLLDHVLSDGHPARIGVEVCVAHVCEDGQLCGLEVHVHAHGEPVPAESLYLGVSSQLVQTLGTGLELGRERVSFQFDLPNGRRVPTARNQTRQVLLAESRPWIRDLLLEQLEAMGCNVIVASTVEETTRALAQPFAFAVTELSLLTDPCLGGNRTFHALSKIAVLPYLQFLDVSKKTYNLLGVLHCPIMPSHVRRLVSRLVPREDGPRVLVVEDALLNTMVATHILNRLGYEVDSVASGSRAVEMVDETDYHLVLMDCQLPEMDGVAATEAIRRKHDRAALPIVAVTAMAMPGDREKCLAAGMDDYLAKPYGAQQLTAIIERWVRPDEANEHP
jgi:CheY-like chemotaxis protein